MQYNLSDKMKKIITPLNIYLLISLSGIVAFFVVAVFKRMDMFSWLIMENNSNFVATDHFRHIFYCQDLEQVYTVGIDACFPPLAYLFYHYLYRISFNTPHKGWYFDVIEEPYQVITYVMFLIVVSIVFSYAIRQMKLNSYKRECLLFSFLFSVPFFAGGIERGNMAYVVVTLMLNAIALRNSDSKWKKELAMIFIAVAAGLKIYPAILGVLYLKEKRWKETIRLIIYGILAFFVPFRWTGGTVGFERYFHMILAMTKIDYGYHVQYFRGLLTFLNWPENTINILNTIFMLIVILAIFLTKDKIREMVYIATFMTLVPNNAYRYTLMYFAAVVYIIFINGEDKVRKSFSTYVYIVGLSAVFSIPTFYGFLTKFEFNYGIFSLTYVEVYVYAIVWALVLFTFVSGIVSVVKGFVTKSR